MLKKARIVLKTGIQRPELGVENGFYVFNTEIPFSTPPRLDVENGFPVFNTEIPFSTLLFKNVKVRPK